MELNMRGAFWLTWVFLSLSTQASLAEEILELNRSFIEEFKNKFTVSATYIVDAAHKRPNPAKADGDMHVAGRAAEIGLATVAEIQNAKDVPDAVNAVKRVEGSGQTIALSGVWHIGLNTAATALISNRPVPDRSTRGRANQSIARV
jgi:hypothetical protein